MDIQNYDALKIENQLCFPLYAASRSIIRRYKPFLDELDLTYTQYITMLVLWEHERLTVKELGAELYLDSGTLTPLLKKLEEKGLINRNRSTLDERNLIVTLTPAGIAMKDRALDVHHGMTQLVTLSHEEACTLYHLLYKLLGHNICTE